MKKITFSLICVLIAAFGNQLNAQSVAASEIIQKAFAGEDVSYSNITVTGDLDLTPYLEKKDDLPSKSWWSGDGNTVDKTIKGAISFENCVFEGAVLAYIHDEESNYTFISHFESKVNFLNCQFKKDIAFKYSDFEESVDFSGSIIAGQANFKYAEFEEEVNFSKVVFKELANFKYAEYNDYANYANTTFSDEANFKYAELDHGVSFASAMFNGFLNLKYCELEGEVNLKDIQVNGDLDTKYTEVNGMEFTSYLLKNK